MAAAAIIVFREVLEAALIIGIVLAATVEVAGSRRWIWGGLGAGVAGSLVVALFADAITGAFSGNGQELFNATVLGLAVVMLAWHSIWMSTHGREMARHLGAVGTAVRSGERPPSVLAVVVGVAVLREGAETVLFVSGAGLGDGAAATLLGVVAGLGGGILVGTLMYLGLLRIPGRYLFGVTGGLITLLAAGMAAQAVSFLAAAGVLDTLAETVWDSSWLLSETSMVGRVLHTMIGYVDRPTGLQLVAYLAILVLLPTLGRLAARAQRASPAHQAVRGKARAL
jgi:high-affinity iron transporter